MEKSHLVLRKFSGEGVITIACESVHVCMHLCMCMAIISESGNELASFPGLPTVQWEWGYSVSSEIQHYYLAAMHIPY